MTLWEPVGDGVDPLRAAWHAPRAPLMTWVRGVGRAHRTRPVSLDVAADAVGTTVAELDAVLRLDGFEDDVLALVSDVDPPSTTWMLLSEVSSDRLREALEGYASRSGGTAFAVVRTVIEDLVGQSSFARVAVLQGDAFRHAAVKAQQYGVWPPSGSRPNRHVNALRSFASRRLSGQPLTTRQAGYALGLLSELLDRGVIRVPSPDGDDELAATIIAAVR